MRNKNKVILLVLFVFIIAVLWVINYQYSIFCHSHTLSGINSNENPEFKFSKIQTWIPVCKGMTIQKTQSTTTTPTIQIGEKIFKVKIASTTAEQERGLSGTKQLAEDEGMLFIFDHADRYAFWMKDMNYPLDIIWIDENWKIVDISVNVSPDTYPKTLSPKIPAKYVLEVKARLSEKYQLKLDEEVNFD